MQDVSDYVYEDLPMGTATEEVWKLLLDRSQTAERMISLLKGEVVVPYKDAEGNPAWRMEKRGDPLMNEKGVRFFTPHIYSSCTPDKIATFISEEEANRLVREMSETLVDIIEERGDEFEIPASNRSYVLRLLEQNYFLALTASRQGTILKAITKGVERREYYAPMPKQKRFNWPTLLGGGRG